ncbi:MAG: glutamate--cysteine ligase [Deltaproteobacteria bacterium]|nr:glutamate--cysteine ligase [Deltaproteobacteria bacterium]
MPETACELIDRKIEEKRIEVEAWFEDQFKTIRSPLYLSVDLRDGGFKVAPVDANLFPAGFNNICIGDLQRMAAYHKIYIEAHYKNVQMIALVPEDHTTNKFYLENLFHLRELIREGGFSVILASPNVSPAREPVKLHSATGKELSIFSLRREGDTLYAGKEKPQLVILNNDLSSGIPPILDPSPLPVLPQTALGWHRRRKIDHIREYEAVSAQFCQLLGLDPWLLNCVTESVDEVDFMSKGGMEKIADAVSSVLKKAGKKYDAYGVEAEPFVMVKNNGGTYGMGVLSVKSPQEMLDLNRSQREKMCRGKGGVNVTSVIVQEGIPSIFRSEAAVAEPVIYCVGGKPAGAFIRAHGGKTEKDNLNARGMTFKPVCLHEPDEDHETLLRDSRVRHVYQTIASLSALAAGREALRAEGTKV